MDLLKKPAVERLTGEQAGRLLEQFVKTPGVKMIHHSPPRHTPPSLDTGGKS